MRVKLPSHIIYFLPLLLVACIPSTTANQPTIPLNTEISKVTPSDESVPTPTADSDLATSPEALYEAASEAATAFPTRTSLKTDAVGPISAPAILEPIIVTVSVYIVDESSDQLSSGRSADQLLPIFDRANEIWAQAGIILDVQSIQRVTLPSDVVQSVADGDFGPFFDGAGRDFSIPDPSLINAFYARDIGGPNGIVPFNARLFFVNDKPSVHHERVTSHEIGHILGLHHTLRDDGRLMFPGTNGMSLTDEEILVARYVAQGLLDRVR